MRYDPVAWPLFDLRVRTARLELRPVDPELAFDLVALAVQGIHDPSFMPFDTGWTDQEPLEILQNGLRFLWGQWATWAVDDWSLSWGVHLDGELVGTQSIEAKQFPTRRTFETGSWVGQAFQGRGIGREMRAAVLHFGFVGLGGLRAETAAFPDNDASLAITRGLGYADDGEHITVRRGERDKHLRFRLDRADWEAATDRVDVAIEGLTPAGLALFGLGDDLGAIVPT